MDENDEIMMLMTCLTDARTARSSSMEIVELHAALLVQAQESSGKLVPPPPGLLHTLPLPSLCSAPPELSSSGSDQSLCNLSNAMKNMTRMSETISEVRFLRI